MIEPPQWSAPRHSTGVYGRSVARVDRARQAQWAHWVIEAAASWGHPGQAFHDPKRDVVTFVGLGDVALDDPDGHVGRSDPDGQRAVLRSRCHQLLARHFTPPAAWMTGDAEQDRAVTRALLAIRERPDDPTAHAAVARWGRALEIDGWEERMRWSAERLGEFAVSTKRPALAVDSGLLWLESGDAARAAAVAGSVSGGSGSGPGGTARDVSKLHGTHLRDHLLLAWLRGGRSALVTAGQGAMPPIRDAAVIAFVGAASAADDGRVDVLREEVARLDRVLAVARRDSGAHAPVNDERIRHMAQAARSWLAELDPTADEPVVATGDHESGSAGTVVASVPFVGPTTGVAWRGDVAVASTSTGDIALDLAGRRTLPPPSMPPRQRENVVVVDACLHVRRSDGALLRLANDWDEDQLEMGDTFEVVRSDDRGLLAVWGEHGEFWVFRADGSFVARLHEHWDGPNYGASFAGGRLLTWAGDHRVLVHDLDLGVPAGVVTGNGWLEAASLVDAGRIVLSYDNVDRWRVHDVDTGAELGPTAPATFAAGHPAVAVIAFVDGDRLWLERYR